MIRKYTKHGITESALKQLQAAANRPDGSLYPGVGYGAPASRHALVMRELAEYIKRPSQTYASSKDCVITPAGELALIQARAEGW